MVPASQDRWITASNSKILHASGISCTRARTAEAIQQLRLRYLISHVYMQNKTPEQAKGEADEMFVLGDNRFGKPVWKIRESCIPQLKDWLAEQSHWISINNDKRLAPFGITHSDDVRDRAAATLYREHSQALVKQESPNEFIRYVMEQKGIRRTRTASGHDTWQVHEKRIPEFRQKLEEVRKKWHEPEWVNTHNRRRWAMLGQKTGTDLIDQVVENYRERKITGRMQTRGETRQQATDAMDSLIRPAITFNGATSWEVNAAYLPKLIDTIRPELDRREKDWFTQHSTRWREAGIRGGATVLHTGMVMLRDQQIERLIGEGMHKDRAADHVARHMVKEAYDLRGKPCLKAHIGQADMLRSIIDEFPDRDKNFATMARRREQKKSPQRGG